MFSVHDGFDDGSGSSEVLSRSALTAHWLQTATFRNDAGRRENMIQTACEIAANGKQSDMPQLLLPDIKRQT